jgi:hypothetical protein
MAQTWTPLHARLGLQPGPLDLEMITRAVDEQLPEDTELDWKLELPHAGGGESDEKAPTNERFTTTVAAMANTRGGLVVGGIPDTKGLPTQVRGMDLGRDATAEAQANRLQRKLAAEISPVIQGVHIEHLPVADGRYVVVVHVPASGSAPHFELAGAKDAPAYSGRVRRGAQNAFLAEYEIAELYRRRHSDQQSTGRVLASNLDDIIAALPAATWVVMAARPDIPTPSTFPALDHDAAKHIGAVARQIFAQLSTGNGSAAESLIPSVDFLNPRIGLRRWIIGRNSGSPAATVAEFHNDGSISVACRLASRHVEGESGVELGQFELQSIVLMALCLTQAAARELNVNGAYAASFDIATLDSVKSPLRLRHPESFKRGWKPEVSRFTRFSSSIPGIAGIEDVAATAHSVVFDVVSQFGQQNIVRFTNLDLPQGRPE